MLARLRNLACISVVLLPLSAARAQLYRLGDPERKESSQEAVAKRDPEAKKKALEEEKLRQFRSALNILATSRDNRELVHAAEVLRAGFPDSRPLLVQAAWNGPTPRTRAFALKLLGELGAGRDDLKAAAVALRDRAASVRLAAVMAIQRLGKEGYPALVNYLPRETKPNNRKMAVKTLERWGDPQAMPLLVRLLKKEKHKGVRAFIVRALEQLSGRTLGDNESAWESFAEGYMTPERRKQYLRLLESWQREGKKEKKPQK